MTNPLVLLDVDLIVDLGCQPRAVAVLVIISDVEEATMSIDITKAVLESAVRLGVL